MAEYCKIVAQLSPKKHLNDLKADVPVRNDICTEIKDLFRVVVRNKVVHDEDILRRWWVSR